MLFSWNVAPVVCIATTPRLGGSVSWSPVTEGIIDVSEIIQFFDHDKTSSISELMVNQEISKNY